MKTIVHLSDLHFGTEDQRVLDVLLADIDGITRHAPTLVAISGDLTQRARETQFRAARHFLDNLLVPYIVVPGNHDVPLYDLFRRFLKPFDLYKEYISEDLSPVFVADDLAVVGITTAHGITHKNGKVTRAMVERVCGAVADVRAPWKVLVAHHPFVIPHGVDEVPVVGAEQALPRLESCGIDVILSGHLHLAHASDVAGFRSDDHKVINVVAGTAISTRLRGEANGYNRLVFDGQMLTVFHRVWTGERFVDGPSKTYRRVERTVGVELDKVAQVEPHLAVPVTSM
jgi:3',5'-cyclic AMP phosphodiesterase CpdA